MKKLLVLAILVVSMSISIACSLGGSGDNTPALSLIAKSIDAGHEFFIHLRDDGTVWTWGYNGNGELGIGTFEGDYYVPSEITFLADKNVVSVEAGDAFAFAICEDGTVYGWGANGDGQLGLGTYDDYDTPQEIPFFAGKHIISLYACSDHSIVLFADGTIYSTGDNEYGQLGLGDWDLRNTFTLVTFFDGIDVDVLYAYGDTNFAIAANGDVYGWGYNSNGDLGLDNEEDYNTPQHLTFFDDKTATDIAVGYEYTLVLCSDGTVYATGNNEYGTLGLGDWDSRDVFEVVTALNGLGVVDIIGGHEHAIAVTSGGDLYLWGSGDYGELGFEDWVDVNTPTLLEYDFGANLVTIAGGDGSTLALFDNGYVYEWGFDDDSEPWQVYP